MFRARSRQEFKQLGLPAEGVIASLSSQAIVLRAANMSADIGLSDIRQMRFGYYEGKSAIYFEAKFWLVDGTAFTLAPHSEPENYQSYGAFARRLAHEFSHLRGVAAIQRGTSLRGALIAPVLLGLLFATATHSSLVVEADTLGMQRWIGTIVTAIPFAIALWLFFAKHRPRTIASLAELDGQLPK